MWFTVAFFEGSLHFLLAFEAFWHSLQNLPFGEWVRFWGRAGLRGAAPWWPGHSRCMLAPHSASPSPPSCLHVPDRVPPSSVHATHALTRFGPLKPRGGWQGVINAVEPVNTRAICVSPHPQPCIDPRSLPHVFPTLRKNSCMRLTLPSSTAWCMHPGAWAGVGGSCVRESRCVRCQRCARPI